MSESQNVRPPQSDCSAMTTMTVLLGTNGTGKTTTLKNILKASGKRCLVITPDDREWLEYPQTLLRPGCSEDFLYQGIRRHIWNPKYSMQMLKYFQNGIIVFDDCRAYLTARTHDDIHQLMIRRRQRNVDIFVVGHGYTEVPPVFFTFATDFILFQTRDNIDRRKHVIRSYEAVQAKTEEVNAIAQGRRAHPKDYSIRDFAGKKVVDIHYCDHIANE